MAKNAKIEEYKKLVDEQTDNVGLEFGAIAKKLAALPGWTAEWVNRRHNHQAAVDELDDQSDDFKAEALARFKADDSPKYANMTDRAFAEMVSSSSGFKKLRRQLRAEQRVVDYLDEVLGVYKFQFGRTLQGLLKIRELDG